MVKHVFAGALGALLLCFAAPAQAQTPAERDLARLTLAKHDAAIVTVLGPARVRVTMGGREAPPTEENLSATAVVIDATGLMAAPLSALDPGRMMSALMGRMAGGGADAMDARSELSNLRVRLADGREVPVRIALRDEDLDVAFLRPVDPPASRASRPASRTNRARANIPAARKSLRDCTLQQQVRPCEQIVQ